MGDRRADKSIGIIEVERISSRLLLVPLLPVMYTVHCTRTLYNGAKY